MKRWRTWSVGICLTALLVPGCARFGNPSTAYPIPEAREWPAYDVDTIDQAAIMLVRPPVGVYSLREERPITPAEIWSVGAARTRDEFWQRILRDRCAAREALQAANGQPREPDPVCRMEPK